VIERREFSTDGLPERRQFDSFGEAMWPGGFSIEPDAAPGRAYAARTMHWHGQSFDRVVLTADRVRMLRRPSDIARCSWNAFWVSRETGDGTRHESGRRELVTRPGDLLLGFTDEVHASRVLDRFDNDVWLMPKQLLDPHMPAGVSPILQRLSLQGVGALVADYLDSLNRQMALLDGPVGEAIVDNLCRLVAIACGAEAPAHDGAVQAARLERAKQHIEQHLADPALTPVTAAAALGISVRWLHKLFEPSGTSFAGHVLRRRLEECRAALTAPSAPRRPVIDIAFAWGFTSLSTFYRSFEHRFGAAPGEFRKLRRAKSE
jgi:AraC-like DNA-binding protein